MKIQQLFDELKKQTENKEDVFADSGIINWSEKMKYGFFPLGLGILTENITMDSKATEIEIEEGGIMVLGNDFGTAKYTDYNCKYNIQEGEKGISSTIKNLLDIFEPNVERTFFTNFYLGVRLDCGDYYGTTMTKRIFQGKTNKLKDAYKKLCRDFFVKQLRLLNPRLVICLGHEVKNALIEMAASSPNMEGVFNQWRYRPDTIEKIYDNTQTENHIISIKENEIFGTCIFMIIPHPCDLRNFKEKHKKKLILELNKLACSKNQQTK